MISFIKSDNVYREKQQNKKFMNNNIQELINKYRGQSDLLDELRTRMNSDTYWEKRRELDALLARLEEINE